jgi:hypothetical protein
MSELFQRALIDEDFERLECGYWQGNNSRMVQISG